MMQLVIGVDPGAATGGLALFSDGVLKAVVNMPVLTVVKRSKGSGIRDLVGGPTEHTQHDIDAVKVSGILAGWTAGQSAVMYLEEAHGRPGQGIVTTGRLMAAFGVLQGVAAALGIKVKIVSPNTWKVALACPATERGACERATVLFPHLANEFKRVKDNHKAEAAMIGLYGVRHG